MFRILELVLILFCFFSPIYVILRRKGSGRKTWLRSFPLVFTTVLLLFLYKRSSRIDLNDAIEFLKEDDFIYRQAIIEPQPTPMVSLKAGITIHVAMTLVFIGMDPHASANAKDTITWVVVYSSAPIHFHILTDRESVDVIDIMMKRAGRQANCQFSYTVETVDEVFDQLLDYLKLHAPQMKLDMIREHVATQMLPLVLPWHFPNIRRLIYLSNRIKLRADPAELYEFYDRFETGQVMGLTLTQGAQFASAFAVHRHRNPDSHLGQSPPKGWPGFNAELMLLDLEKMRQSTLLSRYIDLENQFYLVKEYDFGGRELLPGLDEWLTLIGAEKPELFYTLPCQWNVQQILDPDAFEYCRYDIKAMEFDN